ncbi:MAG: ABC transporter permease [Halothermotrichaceae bacterium]
MVARTQWYLIYRQFKKHKLAVIGLVILIIFYGAGVILPEFCAPYGKFTEFENTYLPPQPITFVDGEGDFTLRPHTYEWKKEMDPDTWQTTYSIDESKPLPIQFFVKGEEYKILGLFETDLHLFGLAEGKIFLFGTDDLGRDLLSRIFYALRISLTIGFVGVGISFVLGMILGGLSGLIGGVTDDLIQRIIEMLMSIPRIPMWMALAAAVPQGWSALQVYFAITVILSLMGWTGLARVIRSKILSIREEDFVKAAESFNASTSQIISRHLFPNMVSYIIVQLSLTIPGMILAETSLSFLGIGLRPPVVSLGVLLQRAQNFQTVSMHPWLLIPGLFVVIAVLAFNFVGDGLRDAADPYN